MSSENYYAQYREAEDRYNQQPKNTQLITLEPDIQDQLVLDKSLRDTLDDLDTDTITPLIRPDHAFKVVNENKFEPPTIPAEEDDGSIIYDCTKKDVLQGLKDDGLQLKVGQKAKIILHQNLSTGYGWQINDKKATGVCEISTKNKSAQSTGMVGVPGQIVISVTGEKAGESTLQAVNVRPWEFKGFDSGEIRSAGSLNLKLSVSGESQQ